MRKIAIFIFCLPHMYTAALAVVYRMWLLQPTRQGSTTNEERALTKALTEGSCT